MLRLTAANLGACLLLALASPAANAQAGSPDLSGSPERGEALFTGAAQLANDGPACVACHTVAGIPFPGGGALGPDLTHAYQKLGPTGTQSAMQTLYFQVMTPIYSRHPLLPEEQADLMAFLKQAETGSSAEWITSAILGAAIVLGAIFVGITGVLWRHRVRSVRGSLVRRATRQGAPL